MPVQGLIGQGEKVNACLGFLYRSFPLWAPGGRNNSQLIIMYYQGGTVVTPYVGMARKQDGGSNGCISNYTAIITLKLIREAQ